MVAVLVILTVVVCLALDIYSERKKAGTALRAAAGGPHHPGASLPFHAVLDRAVPRIPMGLYLDRSHTWAFIEENGTLRVGVDELVPLVMGEITDFEFQTEGTEVSRGKRFLKILHGNRSLTLRSPVDGTIKAVNYALGTKPGRLNADPYRSGWIYRIAPVHLAENLRSMSLGREALERLRGEIKRLKSFVAARGARYHPIGITLQDGGLPATGLSDMLGEEDWERLREEFFGWEPPRNRGG